MNTTAATIDKDLSLLGHVKVSLVAEIGSTELTVDELFSLRSQDLVTLNESVDAEVTLLLNGRPVARGELVAVEDKLGVRITELA
ncbi:FliM/FliN family flagellar motor switch protein [Stenotrophomonas sp.]|uniref:FliM/FliN family flagellar motor switch protein n=1 Tax=Stenotrophomonas sp. TaxID=69392 RepID=UPI002897CBDD|nr:FliM/FliN family flagellar motor switch protein [Stenotrophomonas sp.]